MASHKFQASGLLSSGIKLSLFTPGTHIMGAKIQLHSFINSALDGDEWSVSHPGRFAPMKERYLLNKRLGGAQIRAGRFEKERISYRYLDSSLGPSLPSPSRYHVAVLGI